MARRFDVERAIKLYEDHEVKKKNLNFNCMGLSRKEVIISLFRSVCSCHALVVHSPIQPACLQNFEKFHLNFL